MWTLERFHEPVMVAVWHGSHWVLVTGYRSDFKAYPSSPGTIYEIKIANPWDGSINWYPYSGSSDSWIDYWFTEYTNMNDPDPATGWYIPPPDHWYNHYVTIERDGFLDLPDYGFSINGSIPTHYDYLPIIQGDPLLFSRSPEQTRRLGIRRGAGGRGGQGSEAPAHPPAIGLGGDCAEEEIIYPPLP